MDNTILRIIFTSTPDFSPKLTSLFPSPILMDPGSLTPCIWFLRPQTFWVIIESSFFHIPHPIHKQILLLLHHRLHHKFGHSHHFRFYHLSHHNLFRQEFCNSLPIGIPYLSSGPIICFLVLSSSQNDPLKTEIRLFHSLAQTYAPSHHN